jgi:hypothetical protein
VAAAKLPGAVEHVQLEDCHRVDNQLQQRQGEETQAVLSFHRPKSS